MKQDRVRFVTANYHQLQGLRFVPLGISLLVLGVLSFLGALDARNAASRQEWMHLLTRMGLGFWVALLLSLAAPLYYRLRYGSVAPLDRGRRNGWITAAMIGYLVLARMDASLHWPVSLHLLLVAGALFVTVWNDGPVRFHYLLPASVWLAYSILPGLSVSATDMRSVTLVLGGLTLITCGLGDHIVLAKTLTTPGPIDDVSQSATV